MQATATAETVEKSDYEKQEEAAERCNCAELEQNQPEAEDRERWETVTHGSFAVPEKDHRRTLGRRRELVKSFIGFRVLEEAIKSMNVDPPPQPSGSSEYAESFCDAKFTPFMDRTEHDTRKHRKYPLYGGATVQSYYKSQLDKGTLKTRSDIPNFNEPFRRSCAFTTPPDLALREPTGGF